MNPFVPRSMRRIAYAACLVLALTLSVWGQGVYAPPPTKASAVACKAGDPACARLLGAWFEPAKR